MEQDSKIKGMLNRFNSTISDAFKNKDVETAMFCFGLQIGTRANQINGLRSLLDEQEPVLRSFDGWEMSILRKTQNGSDDANESPNIPDGILFLVNQVHQAIRYNRPNWALFYLIGEGKGNLNSDTISISEFQYFINLFPNEFIASNKDRIKNLCNFLDLTGLTLNNITEDGRILMYHAKSNVP